VRIRGFIKENLWARRFALDGWDCRFAIADFRLTGAEIAAPFFQSTRHGGAISNRQSAQPYASVAAFSLLIIDDGLEQVRLGKVRPKGFRHPEFRVGDLPEEEVAQAQFAARANKQVRIG
jgi:hypothetical protein